MWAEIPTATKHRASEEKERDLSPGCADAGGGSQIHSPRPLAHVPPARSHRLQPSHLGHTEMSLKASLGFQGPGIMKREQDVSWVEDKGATIAISKLLLSPFCPGPAGHWGFLSGVWTCGGHHSPLPPSLSLPSPSSLSSSSPHSSFFLISLLFLLLPSLSLLPHLSPPPPLIPHSSSVISLLFLLPFFSLFLPHPFPSASHPYPPSALPFLSLPPPPHLYRDLSVPVLGLCELLPFAWNPPASSY